MSKAEPPLIPPKTHRFRVSQTLSNLRCCRSRNQAPNHAVERVRRLHCPRYRQRERKHRESRRGGRNRRVHHDARNGVEPEHQILGQEHAAPVEAVEADPQNERPGGNKSDGVVLELDGLAVDVEAADAGADDPGAQEAG
jgi:hypothetical protein